MSSMETVLRLLKSPDQDSSASCRVITVVTGRAASAAADLLSSGDYPIAYPNSTLLYHGIRTYGQRPLTVQSTSLLAHVLRISNDYYAMELARKIEYRFVFRFLVLKSSFQSFREENPTPVLSDLDCFTGLLASRLSQTAQQVCNKAKERFGRYNALISNVMKKEKPAAGKRIAQVEARRLKAIVDFEVSSNKKTLEWSFKDGGLSRLADDFFLLNEYLQTHTTERIKQWCKSLGKFALTEAEQLEIDAIADETLRTERMIAKVQPILQPVWSFFVALCHALQEDESELSATDAYWLGLVDEVLGEALPTLRILQEYQPDPSPAPALSAAPESAAS